LSEDNLAVRSISDPKTTRYPRKAFEIQQDIEHRTRPNSLK
jgi:hypothetical protein